MPYTVKLRDIIDNLYYAANPDTDAAPSSIFFDFDLSTIDKSIEYARTKIFSFDYPAFDTEHKTKLEKDILYHYYNREICTPSVAAWQLYLRNRLNEIMPRYQAIFNSQKALLEADILNPYSIEEEQNRDRATNKSNDTKRTITSEGTNTETRDTTDTTTTDMQTTDNMTNTNKFSNTPQAAIQSGNDYLTSMTTDESETTSTTDSTNTSKGTGTVTDEENTLTDDTFIGAENITDKDSRTKTTKGNLGNRDYAELTQKFEDAVKNLNELIINDLSDLFFMLY